MPEVTVIETAIPPSLRSSIAGIYREAALSWHALGEHEKEHRLQVKASALEFGIGRVIDWEREP